MSAHTATETIRRAASLLRERAEAATPGPWEVEQTLGWDCVESAGGDYIAETGGKDDPNAAYIATMHPGVGLALADWLDATAYSFDVTPDLPSRSAALAVARAILGEAS